MDLLADLAKIKKFLDHAYYAQAEPDTIYLGIDPGLSGAIALLQRRRCCVLDIPVTHGTKKKVRKIKHPQPGGPKTQSYTGSDNWFDDAAILEIFKLLRPCREHIVVSLEIALPSVSKSRAGNTTLTAYRAGAGWNMWPLFLKSKGIQVYQTNPSAWKKTMGLVGKDKEASRALALSLYPKADVKLVKHHDRAEALLLAHYLKFKLEGGK